MLRKFVALSLFAALVLPAAAQDVPLPTADKKPEFVKEPESGINLPVELKVLDGTATHTLTGVAIREKTIFKVDVYAVGHYIDAAAAKTALAKWKGKTAKELYKDDAFIEKLLGGGMACSLRLQLARDVDTEDFNEAFEDALRPRVKKLLAAGGKGKSDDVDTMKGLFTVDELVEGTKLDFTRSPGGKFTVVMDGTKLGVIESPALCRAMWDVYVGKKAIQSEFPRKLTDRFPGILGDG